MTQAPDLGTMLSIGRAVLEAALGEPVRASTEGTFAGGIA